MLANYEKSLTFRFLGMVDQYQSLYDTFRWLIPTQFNIGQECCHRWANSSADARRIALFYETLSGRREIWTYERLAATSNQLANGLTRMGVKQGDRIALILSQRPEALVAHIAAYSIGAVVVPFTPHTTTAVLEQRMREAQARVAIFDHSAASLLLSKLSRYSTLKQLIGIDVQDERVLHWRHLMLRQPNTFKAVATKASDPALLLFDTPLLSTTSKHAAPLGVNKPIVALAPGVLFSHGALIGNLPAFVASQDWFPHGGDVLWSPAEWTRPQGLMQALLPTLYFGQSFVLTGESYPHAGVLEMLSRYRVTNLCIPSQILESIQQSHLAQGATLQHSLRGLATIGEHVLKQETHDWCKKIFNVHPNETFGSAETGQILGHSQMKWPVRVGSLGKPFPGHRLCLIDHLGLPAKTGEVGEIVLNRFDHPGHADPALFDGYWHQDIATAQTFTGDWYRTKRMAYVDQEGYFWPAEEVIGPVDVVIETTTTQVAIEQAIAPATEPATEPAIEPAIAAFIAAPIAVSIATSIAPSIAPAISTEPAPVMPSSPLPLTQPNSTEA